MPIKKLTMPSCQQIINSLPEPFVVIDKNYIIQAANKRYSRHFGYSETDIVGRFCYEVSHKSDSPCSLHGEHCPLETVFDTAAQTQVIHDHYDKNGKLERVRISATPLFDEDNNIQFMGESVSLIPEPASSPLLVGKSSPMLHMVSMVQRVAPTGTTVLLLGESGVGKECVAQYLHQYSSNVDGPLVIVDCSTLGDQLIESELFGHEKGSFTGATAKKLGLIESADSGTLFVDEIGELPLELQTKLLRFLESGTFRRIGGTKYLNANVRVVAATHRDLKRMVAEGHFRQDLYYRISAFPVLIPPLRERKGDIVLLAENFLKKMENGEQQIPLSPEIIEVLLAYDYPGNVRELRNIIERALILSAFDLMLPEHFIFDDDASSETAGSAAEGERSHVIKEELNVRAVDFLSKRKKKRPADEAILQALLQAEGRRKEAAELLGIGERSLYRYIKEMTA